MDKYEIAVLRVLLKNRDGIKVSGLVDGFPDDSKDFILAAIESLQSSGYICSTKFGDCLSISREKRKEAIRVVYPDYSLDLSNNHVYPRKLVKKESSQPVRGNKSNNHSDMERHPLLQTMLVTITILGVTFVVISSVLSQSTYTSFNTLPPVQGHYEVYPAAVPLAVDHPHFIPQIEPMEDSLVFFALPPSMLQNNNEPQPLLQDDVVIEYPFGEYPLTPQVKMVDNNLRASE